MKYKIKFKALDVDRVHLETIIKEFYENNSKYSHIFLKRDRYEDRRDAFTLKYIFEYRIYEILIDFTHMKIAKYDASFMRKFHRDELKLFDSLDFDIVEAHKQNTGQNITDWLD